MMSSQMAADVAQILLQTESVKISLDPPFTWTSGIKSPIYCDNRRLISFVEEREQIVTGLADLVKELGDVDYLAGTATAGIPWAAFLAERMGKKMVYVRSKPKGHGAGKQVEGVIEDGARVIVVEDLISTGGSSLKSADALKREANAEVLGVAAIFAYGFPFQRESFAEANIPYAVLSNLKELAGLLPVEQQEVVADFAQDAKGWADRHGL